MSMNSPSTNKSKGPAFSLERKVGIGLLFILGIGGLVFGFQYMARHLEKPFYSVLYYDGPTYQTLDEREQEQVEEQKVTDTDLDGLTDYEELYVYKTSPYLADSDSDGFTDAEELESGNDPNCPTDKDCGNYYASTDAIGADDVISGIPNSGITTTDVTFDSEEDVVNFLNQMSIDEIRQSLIDSGIPEETVNAIDDETLLELFGEALQKSYEQGDFNQVVENY